MTFNNECFQFWSRSEPLLTPSKNAQGREALLETNSHEGINRSTCPLYRRLHFNSTDRFPSSQNSRNFLDQKLLQRFSVFFPQKQDLSSFFFLEPPFPKPKDLYTYPKYPSTSGTYPIKYAWQRKEDILRSGNQLIRACEYRVPSRQCIESAQSSAGVSGQLQG